MSFNLVESTDGVDHYSTAPAIGWYDGRIMPIQKHGAFTLVRGIGRNLSASISLLDHLARSFSLRNAAFGLADQSPCNPARKGQDHADSTGNEEPDSSSILGALEMNSSDDQRNGSSAKLTSKSWESPPNVQLKVFSSWPVKSNPKIRRGLSRRAVFSDIQRQKLEDQFLVQKYISKPDRKKLAESLGLKDSQVKVWFQNRRMKWRNTKEREFMSSNNRFTTRDIADNHIRKFLVDDDG
ncbi:putative Homeobox protein DBX1 [Hypsibius exemplaris]|uniref:Homeobox protein DBX1 n=1 Tax=Hypsibius exemplaris TaxID=2072580 RepID=A0A9X6RMC8_HYPEX|nr:putative Homeobox protein DBX1 [Hypsibius exemplaris]